MVHELVAEDTVPRLIAGSGTPFEDCGGPDGLRRLRDILSRPRHRDYRDMREWVGPDYDPDACDIEAINRRLKRSAPRRRTSGSAAPASSGGPA
jgi:hypothetical protein